MLQQNGDVKRLMDLCTDKIIDNSNILSDKIRGHYLEQQIFFKKHKRNMKETFRYFNLVNKTINKDNDKKNDKTIYSIKYLRGEDFFSYDHLLVRYQDNNFKGFTFIQL